MKNSVKKILALVLALSMAFCFAACKEDTQDVAEVEVDKGAEEEIEAYLALQQDDLDKIIEELKQQGVDAKIYADGSSLVYEYTLGFDVPDDGIAQFEENAKSSEADLKAANETVFSECAAVEEVVYIYYDVDGTKLSEITIER